MILLLLIIVPCFFTAYAMSMQENSKYSLVAKLVERFESICKKDYYAYKQLYETSPSDEKLLERMRAAATPRWSGKAFETMFIKLPGEQRFYKRVDLSDGITGLLSGRKKIDVEVIALQITIDPKEDARAMVLKLQNIYEVALAAKKLENMCDILLPDELSQYVADLKPCTHKEDECDSYWNFVKERLEQHAAKSTTNHFGVILVPYQQ